jgi:hypothetical protein
MSGNVKSSIYVNRLIKLNQSTSIFYKTNPLFYKILWPHLSLIRQPTWGQPKNQREAEAEAEAVAPHPHPSETGPEPPFPPLPHRGRAQVDPHSLPLFLSWNASSLPKTPPLSSKTFESPPTPTLGVSRTA